MHGAQMIHAEAIEAAKEAMREVTPPPGVSKAEWLAEHGSFALIAGAIAAAAPVIRAQAFAEAAADLQERRPEMGSGINITDYRRGREAAFVLAVHICRARAAAEWEEAGAE